MTDSYCFDCGKVVYKHFYLTSIVNGHPGTYVLCETCYKRDEINNTRCDGCRTFDRSHKQLIEFKILGSLHLCADCIRSAQSQIGNVLSC
jgi:hypothetical protein